MNIVLDSGPVELLTTSRVSDEISACKLWIAEMLSSTHAIVLPEIIVYEIRRELLRINSVDGLQRLDYLKNITTYLPLVTPALDKAADFWAETRKRGKPTASERALDIDVILAAQAWHLAQDGSDVIIATMNQKHLKPFVPAEHWKLIQP